MKVAVRTGALGAALLAQGALAQDATGCFVHAKIYDNQALDGLPTAGYVTGEAACQQACKISPTCTEWTWKAVGNPYKGVLDNGCWTLSGSNTLQAVNFSDTPGRVVSGPKDCPTQAPNGTAAPVATIAPPATAAPTEVGNTANATNATVLTDAGGSGGSFPWWGIVLIAGVAVCVGLAIIGCSCSSKKASKKKKKDKKSKRSGPAPEADASYVMEEAVEAAPLMQSQAPVLAEPAIVAAPVAPIATLGGIQMQPMMAAPVATMSYQPVTYMQPAVYTIAGMPARQPQFTVG